VDASLRNRQETTVSTQDPDRYDDPEARRQGVPYDNEQPAERSPNDEQDDDEGIGPDTPEKIINAGEG
jgi:hypothetical protein